MATSKPTKTSWQDSCVGFHWTVQVFLIEATFLCDKLITATPPLQPPPEPETKQCYISHKFYTEDKI